MCKCVRCGVEGDFFGLERDWLYIPYEGYVCLDCFGGKEDGTKGRNRDTGPNNG